MTLPYKTTLLTLQLLSARNALLWDTHALATRFTPSGVPSIYWHFAQVCQRRCFRVFSSPLLK